MSKKILTPTRAVRVCSTTIYTMIWTGMLLLSAHASAQKSIQEFHGKDAQALLPGTEYIQQQGDVDFPSFVRFAPGKEVPVDNFFTWLQSSRRSEFNPEFQLVQRTTDDLGHEHLRYVQSYQGVPVDQSHFIVHVRSGSVYAFNGKLSEIQLSQTKPVLTEEEALEAATRFVGAAKYMWQDPNWEADLKTRKKDETASYFPKGRLVISNTAHAGIRLAYLFDISALSPMQELRVCVDAITGNILYDVPMESNCEAASVNTVFNGNQSISTELYTDDDYRLRDDCSAAVIHVRDWNSVDLTANPTEIENTTNTWTTMNEIFGGTTLWCTKQAYNYFFNRFSRDSYDDADGDVSALINALFNCAPPPGCISANNASMSFSGGSMKVGLSSAGVLSNSYATVDIIGHEYTHAVTGATAMLVYEEEWGALNESFSDIFGEAIEFDALGSHDWLLGSERDNGAIRSMSDPNDTGDPDTYEGTFWLTIVPPCDGSNDNCGVHRNSGVQNFWFFLLTEGGGGTNDNGDDYDVTGIGITDAEAIAYRNLVVYLGSNSDYADARTGSIQAATDLFGACSQQVRSVMDAWYAVGVGDPFLNVIATVTSNYNGQDISCNGASDGEAIAAASFGTPPYSYAWSNGQNTDTATTLSAGTYTVTVTDDAGCTDTDEITLTEPPPLEIEAGDNQTIYYYDLALACTTLMSSGEDGGVPPYTYAWSSGGTAATEHVCLLMREDTVTIVTYYVTLTDANGCEVVDSVDVCYVDINCGRQAGSKVTVCHFPPDNPSHPQTICVSLNSLADHLSHGDHVANCGFSSPCGEGLVAHIALPDQAILLSQALHEKPLLEAFPDPISDHTTVRFILHQDIHVDVALYDMHGRVIRRVYSGNVLGGDINDIELLREQIPAGMYLLQLYSPALPGMLYRQVIIR